MALADDDFLNLVGNDPVIRAWRVGELFGVEWRRVLWHSVGIAAGCMALAARVQTIVGDEATQAILGALLHDTWRRHEAEAIMRKYRRECRGRVSSCQVADLPSLLASYGLPGAVVECARPVDFRALCEFESPNTSPTRRLILLAHHALRDDSFFDQLYPMLDWQLDTNAVPDIGITFHGSLLGLSGEVGRLYGLALSRNEWLLGGLPATD